MQALPLSLSISIDRHRLFLLPFVASSSSLVDLLHYLWWVAYSETSALLVKKSCPNSQARRRPELRMPARLLSVQPRLLSKSYSLLRVIWVFQLRDYRAAWVDYCSSSTLFRQVFTIRTCPFAHKVTENGSEYWRYRKADQAYRRNMQNSSRREGS